MKQLSYFEPGTTKIRCPHCGYIWELDSLKPYTGFWEATLEVYRNNGRITTLELEKVSGYTRRQIQKILRYRFEPFGLVIPVGQRSGWKIPETHAC